MNLRPILRKSAGNRKPHSQVGKSVRGHFLVLARIMWVAVALMILAILIIGIPAVFHYLQAVCTGTVCNGPQFSPQQARGLRNLGLSLTFYAGYLLALQLLFIAVWSTVAVVIFFRKSDEWLAWFVSLSLLTFGTAFTNFTDVVAQLGPVWLACTKVVDLLALVCIVLLFYLFPDGRFIPRWARILGMLWILWSLLYILLSDLTPVLSQLDQVYFLSYYGALGCGVFAQIYRYVRISGPLQRQQTKWVMYGFTVAIAGFLVLNSLGLIALFVPSASLLVQNNALLPFFIQLAYYVLMLLIPISIGFAILRYRLYDIDILINRTLVYGALTVSLALVYAALIITLQFLLHGFISQTNDIVIVASTLAIAALFQPLRRRIQNSIDRRFYRRKYDSAKTLAAFSATLRDELDLNQLQEQLVAVVKETMQPGHLSLWLLDPDTSRKRKTRPLPGIDIESPIAPDAVYKSSIAQSEESPV